MLPIGKSDVAGDSTDNNEKQEIIDQLKNMIEKSKQNEQLENQKDSQMMSTPTATPVPTPVVYDQTQESSRSAAASQ